MMHPLTSDGEMLQNVFVSVVLSETTEVRSHF